VTVVWKDSSGKERYRVNFHQTVFAAIEAFTKESNLTLDQFFDAAIKEKLAFSESWNSMIREASLLREAIVRVFKANNTRFGLGVPEVCRALAVSGFTDPDLEDVKGGIGFLERGGRLAKTPHGGWRLNRRQTKASTPRQGGAA
jgi:hypothetical protein